MCTMKLTLVHKESDIQASVLRLFFYSTNLNICCVLDTILGPGEKSGEVIEKLQPGGKGPVSVATFPTYQFFSIKGLTVQ